MAGFNWITTSTSKCVVRFLQIFLSIFWHYFNEQLILPYNVKGAQPEQLQESNILFKFKQKVSEPARLAGTALLVHETMDQIKTPRQAWTYNTGQRRVRRAPNVAYDAPGTASDGLRTTDDFDMYNGAPDRYTWELKGKKE